MKRRFPMRILVLVVLSALALAAPSADAADRGFFVGVGAGQVNVQVDDVFGSGYDFDEDHFGYKVFGGYRFFPWLSVEGAFIDAGEPAVKSTVGDTTARLGIGVQSLVAAAMFSLPLGDTFELFIKPGIAYWDSTTSIRVTSPDFSDRFREDDNGTAFFLGGGAAINSGNAALRIEYEWFEVAPEYDSDIDEFVDELDASAGFLSVSVVYRF
jgi:opacity protein-like surface antigen